MTTAQLMHFVVRNVTYAITATGITVTCYTNNPCHLWLRWTNIEPQKHVNPIIVRGAPIGTFIDQCFVVYTDIEQNELGDTFTHTFTIQPWPSCETRWFYFWGTVGGVLSPSRSAIFSYHRIAPIYQPTCHTTSLGTWGSQQGYCHLYARWFKPMQNQVTHQWHMRFKKYPDPSWAYTHELWLLHCNASRWPDYTLAYARVDLPEIAPPDTEWDIFFEIPGVPLTANTTYAYALRCSKNLIGGQTWRTRPQLGTTETCPSPGYLNWTACYCQQLGPGNTCLTPSLAWLQATVALPYYELISTLP